MPFTIFGHRYEGRLVSYRGDPDLIAKNHPQAYTTGECVALVQALRPDVGPTAWWLPGPKVSELPFIPAGSVLGNFEFVNGVWRYGNRHTFHACIHVRSYGRDFDELGQWKNRHSGNGNPVQIRRVYSRGGGWPSPCDDADQYYLVCV